MPSGRHRHHRSQSRQRVTINMKVSVTTEGLNNGLIIQSGIIPRTSNAVSHHHQYHSNADFNMLPTYSLLPQQPLIEMVPSNTSLDKIARTPVPSPIPPSYTIAPSFVIPPSYPTPIQSNDFYSPVQSNQAPPPVSSNKTTTLTTVEVFRSPLEDHVNFFQLPPEPVSTTNQPQYIRAHGPQYETWNQVRTETLLDDPAVYNKEDKYNSPAAKSVQWKPDLEERLTVSSWSSYSEDQESLYRNDSTYNEHPPRVYGLPKETFNPLPTQSPTNQQTYQQPPPNITPYQPTFIKQPSSSSIYSDSKKPYHVTSPTSSYQTDATRRSLDRSQSPGIAILRQQKIITTQSVPEPQYKVDENMGRISRLDGYKHGDLRIRPLSIETESRNYSPTRDDLGRNERDYERRSGERFDDTNSDTRSGGRGCDRRGGDRSLDRNYDRNRSLGPNYDRSLDRVYDRSLDRNYDRSLDRNYNRSLDRVYDRSSDTNYESNRERSSNNARHPSPNNDPRKSRSEQSKPNYGARARSPSWEEHNANDLYITKDALGNVVDLVGDFDEISLSSPRRMNSERFIRY